MEITTKKQLVDILDGYLLGWEFNDIKKASIDGGAKLAGFILGVSFIDAMAGFYAGVTKKQVHRNSGNRFRNFVKQYLPKYNPDKLWEDLRCGLVHSYAEGGTYVFTDNNKAGFHFYITKNEKTLLNLEDFISDLKQAYFLFRKDILSNETIYSNAKKRYESMGIMQRISIK